MDEQVGIQEVLTLIKEQVGSTYAEQVVETAILKAQNKLLGDQVAALRKQLDDFKAELETINDSHGNNSQESV